VELVGVIEN
jgi:vacuolar protein sorting-associated protein 26